MLRTQKVVVVFEESVGAKLVNNYQQLSKIAEGKRGQQLSTINNNCDDYGWSTIIHIISVVSH